MSVFFVTDCGGYACAVGAARINGERCSERRVRGLRCVSVPSFY